jgi:dienelactone hydrolase
MSGSRAENELSRRRFVGLLPAAAAAVYGGTRPAAAEPRSVKGTAVAETSVEVPPVAARMQALEAEAPLAMQFRGTSADDVRRWQAEFAGKLRELIGPHRPPEKYEARLERRVELPTHIREERVLTAEGLAPVPVHLLLPREANPGAAAKRAGILALHGHGEFGHDSVAGVWESPQEKAAIESAKYDYGLKLVERGYVVAVPCLTPFGRRRGPGPAKPKGGDLCTAVNLQMQHLGKLLLAENLRDSLWTLDYLAAHAAVDTERLGCVGLSYGGRMTTFTTALDSRVKVCVIAGAMNVFQERAMSGATSGCQVIPGLLNYGDIPEVAGLIAPRPCVWTVGDGDRLLDPGWVEKFRERQARVYAALGTADQMVVDRFTGGHEWHGDIAYPILAKALA